MDSPSTVPTVELRISISETEPLSWRQLVLPETPQSLSCTVPSSARSGGRTLTFTPLPAMTPRAGNAALWASTTAMFQ